MRRTLCTCSVALLVGLAPLACGGDSPTSVSAGSRMSVAEQLAIEPALDAVADTLLRRGGTAGDTLASQYLRIAARLVHLQGQQGSLTATISSASAQTGYAMHGVALAAHLGGVGYVHVLVAWQGLDVDRNTVQRALVLVGTPVADAAGSAPVAPPSGDQVLRFVDFPSGAAVLASASAGLITVADARFRGDCPGLVNTPTESCTTGRERVSAMTTLALPQGQQAALDVDAAVLPAFLLSTS
jgi:hypothetical protein